MKELILNKNKQLRDKIYATHRQWRVCCSVADPKDKVKELMTRDLKKEKTVLMFDGLCIMVNVKKDLSIVFRRMRE